MNESKKNREEMKPNATSNKSVPVFRRISAIKTEICDFIQTNSKKNIPNDSIEFMLRFFGNIAANDGSGCGQSAFL
jgi:hypothetical protein